MLELRYIYRADRNRSRSTYGGSFSRIFMSRTLSICLDESRDVSFVSGRLDYYLIIMVFHNHEPIEED